MSKTTIARLEPGTEVALANCVTLGRVVGRVKKNVYEVDWKGSRLVMPRHLLQINRGGLWVRY